MNATAIDNPRVRQGCVCPLCRGEKGAGLVTCWTCYRRLGLRYGNPKAERAIAHAEIALQEVRA